MTVPSTLYWDDKDKRFVLIVNNPPHIRHHKIPRECFTKEQAWAHIESEGLLAA